MLSHILYGISTLTHGGLKLTARAAGSRGEEVALTITAGAPLAVVITSKAIGEGSIVVTLPASTTESQLVAALLAASNFKKLAAVEQASGDGTAVVATLAKTNFQSDGGLQGQFQSRLGIQSWSDRDKRVTSSPQGLLWPRAAKLERCNPISGSDTWSGSFEAQISLQHGSNFETQNVILDLWRRALYSAVKQFDKEKYSVIEIGYPEFGFGNENQPKTAGTTSEAADIWVVGIFPIQWTEPTFDPEDIIEYPFDRFQVGLYREPLTDQLGGPGEELLDTELEVSS
jgi:hypothetical protein